MKKNIKFNIIVATTLDGKIAKNHNHFSDWTSKEDKIFLHKMLDKSDCIIVGNNTYKTSIKPLSKRNCIVFTKSVKIIKQASTNCLYINPNNIDITELLKAKKYKNIDILGGTEVFSYFLGKNLIDEIYLTIEPIIFGTGLPLFQADLNQNLCYKLKSIKKLNKKGSILLNYIK